MSGRWLKINLDKESRECEFDLRNPAVCADWVDSLHRKYKVSCSYGGFREDRSHIWRNHYQKKDKKFIHLGVDYNVPLGTDVALIKDAYIEELWRDPDQNGGWGTRVLAQLLNEPLWIIYGHLSSDVNVCAGEIFPSGTLLGKIGRSDENGGWFPHLHLQVMDEIFVSSFRGKFDEIDGYSKINDSLLSHVLNPGLLRIVL